MSPVLISPDGRWWWDGRRWQSRAVEGRLDLFWFTTTPQWFERVLVMGLIGLIPIAGTIGLLGWVLSAVDMVRGGWRELPPAGFQYMARGVAPFLVTLTYAVVILFAVVACFVAGVALLVGKPAQVAAAVLLFLVAAVVLVAWWLLALYLLAAMLIGADRLGAARALDPRTLFRLAGRQPETSLTVALVYGAAAIATGVLSATVAFVIPFGGLLAAIALPAVYALAVPALASFEVDAGERGEG